MKGEGAPIASRASPERLLSILHENPHMLDGGETDFSVNTGKQLILVDAVWELNGLGARCCPFLVN
jgi:hypothetical protein